MTERRNTGITTVGVVIIVASIALAALSANRDVNNLVASINCAILGLALVIMSR